MSKKKFKINLIDILIILLIIAAVAFGIYYIMTRGTSSSATSEATKTIRYVVEFQNIDADFAGAIQEGDRVQYDVKKVDFGTVVGVQESPFQVMTFDYENEVEDVSLVEGKIGIMVTIEVDVSETDRAFTANGSEIRVGQAYSLNFPNFFGTGYCIRIIEQ